MTNYVIDRSELEAVERLVTHYAAVPVAELLADGRDDNAPILPTQVRRLSAGWRGAEWVRAVADYQDHPSVGYASLDELLEAHELPPALELEWEVQS